MSKRERVLLFSLIGVFLLASAGLVYAYRANIRTLFKKTATLTISNPVDNTTTNTATDSSTTATDDTTVTVNPITDAGITWSAAKAVDLNLFNTSAMEDATVKYFEVGKDSAGGTIIVAEVSPNSPMGISIIRFKKTSDNKYYLIAKNSADPGYGEYSTYLANYNQTVFVDNTTVYASLSVPSTIQATGGYIFQLSGTGPSYMLSELDAGYSKVVDTAYGPIYKDISTSVDNNAISTRWLYLESPDSTLSPVVIPTTFIADDGILTLTKTDGTKLAAKYTKNVHPGCGGGSPTSIAKDFNVATRATQYGTTSLGDKLYKVASQDQLISSIYTGFGYGSSYNSSTVTLAQFDAKTTVLLWKDSASDYEIFLNSEYQSLGECGKPVVYLYPEKDTNVSVKVGATISKSEPAYNNGWSVLAKKGGQIVLNNVTYPYLYWEGKGVGVYPTITSGTVVAKDEISATLKSQLTAQGLTSKESADFLEYWLPKMPSAPYVRLTWFDTAQMNQLAPLQISPKPNTTIRVFLDFAGLTEKVNMPAQSFSAPARNGFTAVEWGGLLR
ncbi:MAG: hypothetical protein NTW50_03750 [Candidatus Berkelbacteria bacterium]|nr:hypothetical protein [Candidatus Berkelbacteria bacterium]